MNPDHKIIHPIWLRLNHWINLIALVIMVLSDWRIYNASPLFAFRFPNQITLGGWLGGALLWRFAAMWLLFFNGVTYLFLNIVSGRFKARFFPLQLRDLVGDFIAALKGKLATIRRVVFAPVATFALFVLVMSFAWLADKPPAPLPVHSFECTISITLFSLLPAIWTFFEMRKFASTHYHLAGCITLLFAFSIGAIWLRLYEINDSIMHVVE